MAAVPQQPTEETMSSAIDDSPEGNARPEPGGLPVLHVLMLGFFISYVLLLILPVFLNDSHTMRFFRYIPTLPRANMIGEDARGLHFFSRAWIDGNDPYAVNWIAYPPLTLLLFLPLGLASPFAAYSGILLLSLAGYIWLTLWLPARLHGSVSSINLLFLATGLVSYGLQFELERGQFNIIAVSLCFLGIHLFHKSAGRPWIRFLSYVLLTLAIQLKVYPAIFAVMFVDDWPDWRGNLKRLLALAAGNLLLLFTLGYGTFVRFRDALFAQVANPFAWAGNHSIGSFSQSLGELSNSSMLNRYLPGISEILRDHPGWIALLLLGSYLLCFGLSLRRSWEEHAAGIRPHLLLLCTLGALMIPSISFDYTLALLAGPLVIFMDRVAADSAAYTRRNRLLRWVWILAIAILSFAYSWTLFSYTNKPELALFNNAFPALWLILAASMILTWRPYSRPAGGPSPKQKTAAG
jgi:hypothetical protein